VLACGRWRPNLESSTWMIVVFDVDDVRTIILQKAEERVR
jgi:hypothetical protein